MFKVQKSPQIQDAPRAEPRLLVRDSNEGLEREREELSLASRGDSEPKRGDPDAPPPHPHPPVISHPGLCCQGDSFIGGEKNIVALSCMYL